MKRYLIILILMGIALASGCIQQGTQPEASTTTTSIHPSETLGQIQNTENMLGREVSENLLAKMKFSPTKLESKVSQDGKRVAYAAQESNKWFVVVDGIKGKQYDGIVDLVFSPDSKRVAYAAQGANKWFVVVDGNEEKLYDGISIPIFSPDSKHLAYMVQVDDRQFVVVDGKEGKQYDSIGEGTLVFSPDSKRVAYAAQTANKWFVVVDGSEGKEYDSILGEGIIFDSPDSFHYFATRGTGIYSVEERIS